MPVLAVAAQDLDLEQLMVVQGLFNFRLHGGGETGRPERDDGFAVMRQAAQIQPLFAGQCHDDTCFR